MYYSKNLCKSTCKKSSNNHYLAFLLIFFISMSCYVSIKADFPEAFSAGGVFLMLLTYASIMYGGLVVLLFSAFIKTRKSFGEKAVKIISSTANILAGLFLPFVFTILYPDFKSNWGMGVCIIAFSLVFSGFILLCASEKNLKLNKGLMITYRTFSTLLFLATLVITLFMTFFHDYIFNGSGINLLDAYSF